MTPTSPINIINLQAIIVILIIIIITIIIILIIIVVIIIISITTTTIIIIPVITALISAFQLSTDLSPSADTKNKQTFVKEEVGKQTF